MNKNIFLASSMLVAVLLLAACGSQPSSSESKVASPAKEELQTETPKVGGSVVGSCTLIGDIRSFEISSDQQMRSYSLMGEGMLLLFSARETLTIKNAKLNGVERDMKIEVQDNKVIGYEKLVENLNIRIMFQDNSKCDVSLWEAK